jgi:hypothetical protein
MSRSWNTEQTEDGREFGVLGVDSSPEEDALTMTSSSTPRVVRWELTKEPVRNLSKIDGSMTGFLPATN